MGNIGDIVVIRKRKPYKIHNSAMVYTDYVYTGMYGVIIYKKMARTGAFFDVFLANGQIKNFHRRDMEIVR